MKLLEGFKKLLGQAGEAVGAAAGAGVMGGVGKGAVNMMRKPMPQQMQQRMEQPMQPRAYMNRMGENLSQEQLGQRVQRGRDITRQGLINDAGGVNYPGTWHEESMAPYGESEFVQNPNGMYRRPAGSQVNLPISDGVTEDSAFGYTQDGIMPLTSAGPEKSWRPMYQLPNQEEHFNPFMRLMRRR